MLVFHHRSLKCLLSIIFVLASFVGSEARADLTINLNPAYGALQAQDADTSILENLFPGEAERMARVIEKLPEHVKAWPGMLIVKVGSQWASITIVFPDEVSTRMVHLAAVSRPYSEWTTQNQIAVALSGSQGGLAAGSMITVVEVAEQAIGDPYRTIFRDFHDDGNIKSPTLLELRLPLDGLALVNVLNERAALELDFSVAGEAGRCTEEGVSGVNCTLGQILGDLITAAYGETWTPNVGAISPLGIGLDLARTHGPESLRQNGCPIVSPRREADDEVLDQERKVAFIVGFLNLVGLAPEDRPADAIETAALLRDYPDLVELALGGVQDPEGLTLVECALRREILHGEAHPLPNTILRSRWYDRSTHLLDESVKARADAAEGTKPELYFFDAASHVTRTVGIGLVDLIEREEALADFANLIGAQRTSPISTYLQSEIAQSLGIFAEDAEIDQTELPSEDARAMLRELNLVLFRNNRQMIREVNDRLARAPEGAARFADPASPPGANALRQGLWFDLRMVLFEQGLIERVLAERRNDPNYLQVVADIDSSARLGQALAVVAGYQRTAWIDRLVYGAVARAEAEITQQGRYVREDGGPIYAPRGQQSGQASFDTYWHRITIGSTYGIVLRYLERPQDLHALCRDESIVEADLVPCRETVENLLKIDVPRDADGRINFLGDNDEPEQISDIATLVAIYMRLRFETAPRPDEGNVRAELMEIEAADFTNGLETELTQVLSVLQPGGTIPELLNCTSVDTGPEWVKVSPEIVDIFAARRALVEPAKQHWTTLADLYDIMRGGALPRAPRLGEGGTRDAEICEGIRIRHEAVIALLKGEARADASPVRIPYAEGGGEASVGINDDRAVWLRAMARQIWPHLAQVTCSDPSAVTCGAWSDAAATSRAALDSYTVFRKTIAALRLLSKPENANAIGALGFDPALGDPVSLLTLLEGPPLKEGPRIIQEGNSARLDPDGADTFLARFEMTARLERLKELEDAQEYLDSARTETITPLPVPISPRAGNDGSEAEEVAAGQRTPAGLRVRTVRTGYVRDETGATREVLAGELVYQLPVAASQLGVARLDPETATQADKDQFASVTASSVPLQETTRTIPLGLSVTDLIRMDDRRLSVLPGDGSNQLLVNSAATAAALRELGLPDVFSTGSQRLEASRSDDGALDVSLTAVPELAGIELNAIKVPLIQNGEILEEVPERLAQELQISITETFNQAGVNLLTDLLKPFQFDTTALPGIRLTFGFDPNSSCVTLAPAPDCNTPPQLASIDVFEPSIQAGFKLNLELDSDVDVTVSPKLNLTLTREGLVFRGTDLSDLGDEAVVQIEDHLAGAIEEKLRSALADAQVSLSDFKVSLGRSNTTVARNGLQVGLSLLARIGDACDVPVSLNFELKDIDDVEKLMRDFLDSGEEAARDCLTDAVVDTIENIDAIKAFLDQPYQIGDTQFEIAYDDTIFDEGLPDDAVIPFSLKYNGGEPAPGLTISMEGFALSDDAEDREKLDALVTRAFSVRLSDLMGGVVRVDALSLTQAQRGKSLRVLADLTIEDVPFLGDIKLPLINLADPGADNIEEKLLATLVDKVAAELHRQLPEEMDIPLVGEFTRVAISVDLSDSERPKLALEGQLRIIEELEIPATILIPLKGSISDLEIEIDEDKALEQLNAFSPLNDAFAFGPLTVSNARVGQVPGKHGRYAIFLDATLGIDGLFKLGVDNIMINDSGIRLGATISGSIPYPVETTVVALSSIGVTIHTGEDDAKSGLVLDTDISPITAASAALAKVNARLDLRDIGNLAFRLDGDLIVLNSIPLLFARGDVALKDLSFDFEAGTVPALENIISLYGAASLRGKESPPTFEAQTRLSVLRVTLEESEFKLTIDDPGEIYFLSETNMLIAQGHLKFASGLDLSNLSLEGGMELDLFGWSPGGVFMAIDSRRSRADIEVLFAKLGITVRHADLFDPQLVIDMLLSLFDISLEDLLKIRIDNIQIAAGSIGADGSTGTDGDASSDTNNDSSSQSDAEGDESGSPASPPREVPAPDPKTGARDSDDGHPANEGGTQPGRRYCDPIIKEADGTLRYRFQVYAGPIPPNGKSFWSHPHPGSINFHGETFRRTAGDPMSNLCTGSMTNERLSVLGDVWVPRLAPRSFDVGPTDCIGFLNLPLALTINGDFALDDEDTELSEFTYNRAKSPVLCWRLEDESVIFAHAQIFESNTDGSLRALIFCPGPEQIAGFRTSKDEALYQTVCVNGPMSRELDADIAINAIVETEAPEEWGQPTIRIVKPAAEQQLIEELRADLTDESLPTRTVYTLANGVEARVTSYDSDGQRWSRVSFVVLSSGQNLSSYVFDHDVSTALSDPITTRLAESVLQAWYDRLKTNSRARPKTILDEGVEGTGLFLLGYGRKPNIDTLDWILVDRPAEPEAEARPAIKVNVSDVGTLPIPSIENVAFLDLPINVLPYVDRATAEWPEVRRFEMILSEYDPVLNRRYFAIRPNGRDADNDRLLIAAFFPTNRYEVAGFFNFSTTPSGYLGEITPHTHAQLRCLIINAHNLSSVTPLSATQTTEIDPWKIIGQPTGERQRLNLANDPISAMFISKQVEGAC